MQTGADYATPLAHAYVNAITNEDGQPSRFLLCFLHKPNAMLASFASFSDMFDVESGSGWEVLGTHSMFCPISEGIFS